MAAVSEGSDLIEAYLAGGLSTNEARASAELDPSTLENRGYEPSDIPALGVHLEQYPSEESSLPAYDSESYINQLFDDPDEIVPQWSHDEIAFENLASNLKEKRDEYALRTIYALQDSLNQDHIDEVVEGMADQNNYKYHSAPTCDGGNLGLVLGQYLSEIRDLVQDEDVISEVSSTIEEEPEASAAAAANVPLTQLTQEMKENLYIGGEELTSDNITTRLRNMQGAGKCSGIEEGHIKSLLSEEPSRNNTILTMNDWAVGSIKYDGDESMLGLKDLTYRGRQVLQKGMAYRVSHGMLDQIESGRMNDEQSKYSDFEVAPLERLELRPLRFAGNPDLSGDNFTVEGFRENIDTRIEKIETII